MITTRIGLSGYMTKFRGNTTTGNTRIEAIQKMFLLLELTGDYEAHSHDHE